MVRLFVKRDIILLVLYDDEVREFAEAVRDEWGMENNLHWHLDFTFKEDKNLTAENRTS